MIPHVNVSDNAAVTIIVTLVVVGLISGALSVAPLQSDTRRWGWVLILLLAAVFFCWRFLL